MKEAPAQTKPAQEFSIPADARRLKIGQSYTTQIPAREFWCNTEVFAETGEEYLFTATGDWTDWFIHCDANGYKSLISIPFFGPMIEVMRRMPKENWFALIGCLDKNTSQAFLIGKKAQVEMKEHGMITCFANDVPWAYWNNRGTLTLKITRMR